VEVDPRSSVRMSMSVSFQLKKQIQQALGVGDRSTIKVKSSLLNAAHV
jgi:hypothetical protein